MVTTIAILVRALGDLQGPRAGWIITHTHAHTDHELPDRRVRDRLG
jgi:hypothetical protein